MTAAIIAIIVVVVLIIIVVGMYNALVRTKIRVEEAWSDITVQLKRRYDLIPNLVNAVKGYAKHESEVFQRVTEARANALNAQSQGVKETAKAENQFEDALKAYSPSPKLTRSCVPPRTSSNYKPS